MEGHSDRAAEEVHFGTRECGSVLGSRPPVNGVERNDAVTILRSYDTLGRVTRAKDGLDRSSGETGPRSYRD